MRPIEDEYIYEDVDVAVWKHRFRAKTDSTATVAEHSQPNATQ